MSLGLWNLLSLHCKAWMALNQMQSEAQSTSGAKYLCIFQWKSSNNNKLQSGLQLRTPLTFSSALTHTDREGIRKVAKQKMYILLSVTNMLNQLCLWLWQLRLEGVYLAQSSVRKMPGCIATTSSQKPPRTSYQSFSSSCNILTRTYFTLHCTSAHLYSSQDLLSFFNSSSE